ncbi:hypothetical protein [Pseudomonas faucium]|uniref:hypothetical protein n=1 Tax=Pseudomonas faucium TaxID=2740518 RepID=UPI001F15B19C|nr:hypothetical protein [Pseudomonas faucium]
MLITGAIVLFGLTGKSSVLLEVFPGLQASPLAHAPAAFVLGVLCLVGVTVFERASVLHLIAQNEELINVIDSVS